MTFSDMSDMMAGRKGVLPMPTNEPNLTPPKSPVDPFYSERNLQHLEQIVQDIKNGTAHFTEHNLIED